MAASDLYISLHVEADGPIPGPTGWGYSMLALGACVAGGWDEGHYRRLERTSTDTWYMEFQPISANYLASNLEVAERGLRRSRAELVRYGVDPVAGMRHFARWVGQMEQSHGGAAVAVGWPTSWDFGTWVYPYLMRYNAASSPFSHGYHRDIRAEYCCRYQRPIRATGKRSLPKPYRSSLPLDHNALDQAIEAAELFAVVMADESNFVF